MLELYPPTKLMSHRRRRKTLIVKTFSSGRTDHGDDEIVRICDMQWEECGLGNAELLKRWPESMRKDPRPRFVSSGQYCDLTTPHP